VDVLSSFLWDVLAKVSPLFSFVVFFFAFYRSAIRQLLFVLALLFGFLPRMLRVLD